MKPPPPSLAWQSRTKGEAEAEEEEEGEQGEEGEEGEMVEELNDSVAVQPRSMR
jgi:hypothetical protein